MGLNLKDKEWGEFLFPDIFDIKKGFYNKKPQTMGKGKIPFLGATANNNGMTEFYTLEEIGRGSRLGFGNNEPLDAKIFKGNCIAVTNNGSVGHAYYQIHDFTCSHDINPLYLKNRELNKYIAYFLITTIEKQKVCFEYARKWRPMRMVKSKILLPINTKGEPDYDFMEQYTREQEATKTANYKVYITQRLEKLRTNTSIEPLNAKEWREFFITEVFTDIQRGKRLKKDDHIKGKVPYVSSSAMNNGVDGFIGNKDKVRVFRDCLTLANSGSVGATFYQPFQLVASDHVTKLENNNYNKYVYLFIANMVSRISGKYSFNREINDTRIKREKIMLPINSKGEPDYEYMEEYMKALEYKKLKAYLDWKN